VDHGQFEVGVSDRPRDAAVLGEENDEKPRAIRIRGAAAPERYHSVETFSISLRDREPDNLARTRKAKNNAGSDRQAKVTSRDAPIPSKEEPVSRAAVVVKKRAKPKRLGEEQQVPVKAIGEPKRPKGMRRPAIRTADKVTTGPATEYPSRRLAYYEALAREF